MNPTVLHLRPLQHRDSHALTSWGRDELFCRHAGWSASSSAALHNFWLRQIHEPPVELLRMAAENDDGELVGYVDLDGPDPGEKELGFVIGPSRRWGHGLGRQAALAGLAYGFEELIVKDIWAEALAANAASVRILRSLGMKETGVGESGAFLGDDTYYLQFRIGRADWRESALFAPGGDNQTEWRRP